MTTFVILVFGLVDRRKCLDLLLDSVALIPDEIELTILIVGEQSRQVRDMLQGEVASNLRGRGRLVEVNQFILFDETNYPFSGADLTWVVYDKDFVFVSSVLSRSAMAGCAVIGRNHGLIGRAIKQAQCGVVIDSDAPEDVATALMGLVQDRRLRMEMGEHGKAYFSQHTADRFARPLLDPLLPRSEYDFGQAAQRASAHG